MRHIFHPNVKSFTISEILVVVCIMTIVMGGVFSVLQTGRVSSTVASAELDVRSELRRAVEWISKDVRQARRVDVGSTSNEPSSSHIKFQMVTGYLPASGDVSLNANIIEYTYNSSTKILTRTETTTGALPVVKSWIFRYIEQAPFYTRAKVGSVYEIKVIDGSALSPSPVIQSGNLVLKFVGSKQLSNNAWTVPFYLTEEVRIRN